MGVAWKAFDATAGRYVVLKFVPKEIQFAAEAMNAVRDSFRRVHALQHQHICPLYGLFDDPNAGLFLVMKFVDGLTLNDWRRQYVEKHDLMSFDDIVQILRAMAEALDYAHERKVMHRDIKPQNVIIGVSDGVQVIDFGLADEIRSSMERITGPIITKISGTRPYMAPEQWQGKPQDARTDQYALAVTAYELLVGYVPFRNNDSEILRNCVLNDLPTPIPGLPEHVNPALFKGLAKNREDRFENCVAFVDALTGDLRTIRGILWNRFAPALCIALVSIFVFVAFFASRHTWKPTTKTHPIVNVESVPPVPSEPEPKTIPELENEYISMIAPGKKYVTDWFIDGESGKLGVWFEIYDDETGQLKGFFFDPDDPGKRKSFTGKLDKTLQSKSPLSLSASATSNFADATSVTPTQKYVLNSSFSRLLDALLVKEMDMLVKGEKNFFNDQIEWRLKPLSEEAYQKMAESVALKSVERCDRIMELVQPEKCYVSEWSAWGYSGRLGILIETFDKEKRIFTGVFFDPDNIGLEKKFEGTFDLTKPISPYKIVAKAEPNWVQPREDERISTDTIFLSQNASLSWTLDISGDVLNCSGRVPNALRNYSRNETLKLQFVEKACNSQMRKRFDQSELEKKSRMDRIREFIRPGKQYVTQWSLNGVSGRLGMTVKEIDEQNNTFSGTLFDVDNIHNMKHYLGTIAFGDNVNQPYRIQTTKSDGIPFDGKASPTSKLFLMQGRNIDWNLGIEDRKLVGTGYAYFVPTLCGDVKFAFEEIAPLVNHAEKREESGREEKTPIDKLKEYIRPGKQYVAKWSFGGRGGRLGMSITKFNEENFTFPGVLFDPNKTDYKKEFSGFFTPSAGESRPFRIITSSNDGMPYFNHPNYKVDRWTSNIFLSEGKGLDWKLGIQGGMLTCTEEVNSSGFFGEKLTLLFEENLTSPSDTIETLQPSQKTPTENKTSQ